MPAERMVARKGTTLDALSVLHRERARKNLQAQVKVASEDGNEEEAEALNALLRKEEADHHE